MWSSSKDKQLLKIKLTCILTLLLEIGCKGSDFKGHFVLDVKWGACTRISGHNDKCLLLASHSLCHPSDHKIVNGLNPGVIS